MPKFSKTVETTLQRSYRVAQVAGMFDVPLEDKLRRTFDVELPAESDDWQIGLIVGPSGSGKSTIARAAYGNAVYEAQPDKWRTDQAVIDGFGELPTKSIVRTLTAVGFSSPPSWLKPYSVLSNGERFRCDLARALLTAKAPLVVFDEFTSVVDRNVAKVCSAAVAKQIRCGAIARRFVAVTCHYDVAEWLQADWVFDMATGQMSRRRLWRPQLALCIHRGDRTAWPTFAPHHYLSSKLNRSARCFVATIQLQKVEFVVGFAATLPLMGRKGHRRVHRIVVLPDFQGIGIGSRFLESVAQIHRDEALRINITTSHPAIIGHCRKSSTWRTVNVRKHGSKAERIRGQVHHHSAGRAVASFEYCQPSQQKKK